MNSGLIFLISQPRAGSTLLQRILGGHPDIHTQSEPWLMFPPLYALRSEGLRTEYGAALAKDAMLDFIGHLPGGHDDYFEAIRRMYGFLYEQALSPTGKKWFLDKTPRYYHIIPGLLRVFPAARFILLFRNPMAVLGSVMRTWVKADWFSLYNLRQDLLKAPDAMLKGLKMIGDKGLWVCYEDLTEKPESVTQRICRWIGVADDPSIIAYKHVADEKWLMGDQKIVRRLERPVSNPSGNWIQMLSHPQIWRIAHDYYRLLGKKTIREMGYDTEDIERSLDETRPPAPMRMVTLPFLFLAGKNPLQRSLWDKARIKMTKALLMFGMPFA